MQAPMPRGWTPPQGPGPTSGSTAPNSSGPRQWGPSQGLGSIPSNAQGPSRWSSPQGFVTPPQSTFHNPTESRGWGAPQGPKSPIGTGPPNPPMGFQNFQNRPNGPGPRFSSGPSPQGPSFNNRAPQQGPQTGNRMPFNHQERPLLRPSQFSGPPKGPGSDRPPFTNNPNQFGNRNPFSQGPGPRFGNQNGHPGMMRGPRPNFHRPNGPRFHQHPFNKVLKY